jgi:hypothetical protein
MDGYLAIIASFSSFVPPTPPPLFSAQILAGTERNFRSFQLIPSFTFSLKKLHKEII